MDFANYDISSFTDNNKIRYMELINNLDSLDDTYYNDTNEMQYLDNQEYLSDRQVIINQLMDIINVENENNKIRQIDELLNNYNLEHNRLDIK